MSLTTVVPSRSTTNSPGMLNSPGPSPEVPNSRRTPPDGSKTRTRALEPNPNTRIPLPMDMPPLPSTM